MISRGQEEPNEPRYRANPFIWVIPLILSGVGILMITSTTSPNSFVLTGTPFQTGLRQLRWLAIAVCGMFFVYSVPVRIWKRFSAPLYIMMWLMTWLPLIPGIGDAAGGASRWIRLPGLGVSLQPGELLALALALHIAKLLTRDGDRDPLKTFTRVLTLVVFTSLPLLAQPDLGTTILVFTVAMGMYVERIGWRYPLIAGGFIGGVAFPLLILLEPYRMRRVFAFLDPWADPLNKGFQAIQGLIAFANGGMWGSGLGHGFQKLNYLPAAYTDFIYAAIGEELGFIGTACVLALFGFWILQTRAAYFRTQDDFKASLIWGITLTVFLPFVINIAGVTKMMPLKGMALPRQTPCAGVSTLEALARCHTGQGVVICTLDARRGQVYWAAFDLETHERLTPDAAAPVEEAADFALRCKKSVFFVGDGAALCYNVYKQALPCPPALRVGRAAGAALAAREMWKNGLCVSPARLMPDYLRLSQAERERAEREAQKVEKGASSL